MAPANTPKIRPRIYVQFPKVPELKRPKARPTIKPTPIQIGPRGSACFPPRRSKPESMGENVSALNADIAIEKAIVKANQN